MRRLTIVFASCVLASACGGSESSSGRGGEEPNDPGIRGVEPDGGGNKEKEKGDPQARSAVLDIVLNEAAPRGPTEWLELANRSEVEIDIGGYFLADSDKSTGQPKRKAAMEFPAGTKMKPNEYIVILTSKKAGPVGPYAKANCLPDGPDTCFHATFGVSAKNGESIHLLAPDGAVVWSTAIPKSLPADAGGSVDETQCRLPDMRGDFEACTPTPGQPNRGL